MINGKQEFKLSSIQFCLIKEAISYVNTNKQSTSFVDLFTTLFLHSVKNFTNQQSCFEAQHMPIPLIFYPYFLCLCYVFLVLQKLVSTSIQYKSQSENQIKMASILHQYKIVRKLGRGGFGEVYLATDSKGNQWAVKQMNKKRLGKDQLDFIYNEIEVMRELNSLYIVKLFTTHENDEYIYIVLEYCNGGDIRKDMSRQPEKVYKLKQAAFILSDVIRGLEVVHKKGILHRDIKIDNILVHIKENKKVFKIADFGLSTLESRGDMVLGTGSYMSPELYNQQEYGFEVDMWSFGVVFYFMLNKQFPFKLSPYNNESLEIQYDELVKQAKGFSYQSFVEQSKYKYTDNCTANVEDLFKKIFAIKAEKRITFSEIRSHIIFKQFFPEEMDQDSMVLYKKKTKVKDITKKPTTLKKSKSIRNIQNENVETKKNIQIQQISNSEKYPKEKQFILQKNSEIQFLYLNFREFKDARGVLTVEEKMPLCYNLIKYYLILKRKFIQSLATGKICQEYDKEFENMMRSFLKTQSYRNVLLELQQQYDDAIVEFETLHGECAVSLDVICEINPTFGQNFNDDIKNIDFDQFKSTYRKSTTYVFKKLKKFLQRGTMGNKCNYFLVLAVMSHAFNRLFIEKQNLGKALKGYLQYSKSDVDSIDYNKLRVWMSKCTPEQLNNISIILVTKYFEKTYSV